MFLLDSAFWEVRETEEKGKGVFAKKDILPGTVIGDYLGTLVKSSDEVEERHGLYAMGFDDDLSILPEIESIGVHLINHSCSSNCDMYPYHGRSLYFSNRYIFTGEELTVQYSLPPPEKNHRCNHICYCYSPICHGTMHTSVTVAEKIDEYVQRIDGKYLQSHSVKEGDVLTRLATYPENIPDDPLNDLFGCLTEDPAVYPSRVLPSIAEIRQMLRKDGKLLEFPYLNTKVFGVMNGLLISM